jgi:DNA helicase IV
MTGHKELSAEQAYIDRAYEALEAMRGDARLLHDQVIGQGRGGTFAARVERDVMVAHSLRRLESLELGRESLVFGRMDREPRGSGGRSEARRAEPPDEEEETFYIGRVAVAGPGREPLVVDWRAPVAEAFYRATGLHPLGLRRRRHFLTDGQKLLHIEDEMFAAGETGLAGTGALVAALERARTGRMRDIVATVQREQDEVIRAPIAGILVVQGGPGTGKTAVALHRAAYLLFTHRHRLERDGVLVIGPNQLFLRYISQVLPALGESGVALSTVSGLVDVRVRGEDAHDTARLKGDPRMVKVIAKAVADAERPLPAPVSVTVKDVEVTLTVKASASVVSTVRRRREPHNDGRRHVDRLVVGRLYRQYVDALRARNRSPDLTRHDLAEEVAESPELRRALNRMWPRLRAAELVHDLYGSRPLIALAARGTLSARERELLFRPWSDDLAEVPWTDADVALIDEAASLLGPVRRVRGVEPFAQYGHIVADEAQELSPMQLRMLARRSRTGSMTIVGDIGQGTGPWAPTSWDDIVAHLPRDGPSHRAELTINYRTPGEIMDVASRLVPDARPPEPVRRTGEPVSVETADVATVVRRELHTVAPGTVGVVVPASMLDETGAAMSAAGVEFETGIDAPVALMDVSMVKGLEFDAVVVVEPGRVMAEAAHGPNALYVALTRATRRAVIVGTEPFPTLLIEAIDAASHLRADPPRTATARPTGRGTPPT